MVLIRRRMGFGLTEYNPAGKSRIAIACEVTDRLSSTFPFCITKFEATEAAHIGHWCCNGLVIPFRGQHRSSIEHTATHKGTT
jgi:hypothetical protein